MSTHTAPSSTGPAISVVMPVYNAREYLPFTLRNIIVDQFGEMKPEEWELIAVDDGSSDGSHLEIEPWIEKYPQSVKLIRKSNGGPSSARNAGLAAARGTYVYFCDSDDIILRGALPRLLTLTSDSDMVKFMHRIIDANEYSQFIHDVPSHDIQESSVRIMGIKEYIDVSNAMTGPPVHFSTWQTLYRRELLTGHNLQYDQDLSIGEDVVFTWNALLNAKTICFVDSTLFFYHQRPGSISNRTDKKKIIANHLEHLNFAARMEPVRHRLNSGNLLSVKASEAIGIMLRFEYLYFLTTLIVEGAPLGSIYKAMRRYHKYGGDVHPGRPRFTPYYETSQQTFVTKLRRMVVAYVFGSLIKTGL